MKFIRVFLIVLYLKACGFNVHDAARRFIHRFAGCGHWDYPRWYWWCLRTWHWTTDPRRVLLACNTSWALQIRKASTLLGSSLCPVGQVMVDPNASQYSCYAVIVLDECGKSYLITEDEEIVPLTIETTAFGVTAIRPEKLNASFLGDVQCAASVERCGIWRRMAARTLMFGPWLCDRWRFVIIIGIGLMLSGL